MADTKVQSPETTTVVDDENQRVATSPPPPLQQQQQQWKGMRYPSPMVMPHHMMYAAPPYPPYPPYHHHHHHQFHHHHQSRGNKHQNASNTENKTIWVGDLLHWMDENYLNSSFSSSGEVWFHTFLSFTYLCFYLSLLLNVSKNLCYESYPKS